MRTPIQNADEVDAACQSPRVLQQVQLASISELQETTHVGVLISRRLYGESRRGEERAMGDGSNLYIV